MGVTPGSCGRVSWYVPGRPAGGFDELTFPMTVHSSYEPDAGWFFAQQYSFLGGLMGYTGIQPRENNRWQSTKFSVFGEGARQVDHGGCHGGADGGSGVTCSAWLPFAFGTRYEFTVARDAPGSRVWRGRMLDTGSGETSSIGAWELPHDGGLDNWQVGFMEYFLSVPDCDSIPQASLHFEAPFHAPTGTVGRCYDPAPRGRCKDRNNWASEAKPDGRVWMRAGWPLTRRHIPAQRTRCGNTEVTVNVNVHQGSC